ncbi:MAG: hypothetical protein IPH07_19905 [Deltaproteobacteria bacterium]|nr:hypothetical protein [Deltaproteobacteria bacterium]MBK8715970.1 hypothetical protein [Deltaproteobacteria bacterium]MBP7289884.1 hypothetical protein [Nannocystaceae bacterium]
MNLLGHAMVARWFDRDPYFVLGAMLPDLRTIARASALVPRHGAVASGVAMHHRTDAAFHGLPEFVAACVHAGEELAADGVRRGPRLAVAHVGLELLLDGELAHDAALVDDFVAALAIELPLDAGVREVMTRLHRRGAPHGHRDPHEVQQRLAHVLGRHPRLTPMPEELMPIRAWLERAQARLRAELPRWIDGLRRRMDAPA